MRNLYTSFSTYYRTKDHAILRQLLALWCAMFMTIYVYLAEWIKVFALCIEVFLLIGGKGLILFTN